MFQTAHNQEFGQEKEQGTPIARQLRTLFRNANQLLPKARDLFYRGNLRGGERKDFAQQYNRLAKDWNFCRQAYSDVLAGFKDSHSSFGIQEKLQQIVAKLQSLMAKKYIPRQSDNEPATPQAPQKDAKKYRPAYAGVAAVTIASALLGACDNGTSAYQEPTPIVAEYNPKETELENPTQESTGEEVLENTQDAPLIEEVEAPTQTPKEPLAIEFVGVENLSSEELNNLNENTSAFTDAVEAKVNQDPTLKAALYDSEGGLKVAFNPNNLFFHNGIWGYFAPEGGPLSNNLLIISNAPGSEGEIRFCSIPGANEILGLSLKESDHYLDFTVVDGQNVCLVRKNSDGGVVAINNAAGQWSRPENSGLNIASIGQSAREIGKSAVAMAAEEEVVETEEVIKPQSNEQLAIKAAEAAGINLFDLKSSDNPHVSKNPSIDTIQRDFENSFGTKEIKAVYMFNIDLELNKEFIEIEKFIATTKLTGDELDKELTIRIEAALAKIPKTNGGWQHIIYSKNIINIPGQEENKINPQPILTPMMSYNANTGELWIKRAINSTYIFEEGLNYLKSTQLYGGGVELTLVNAYAKEGYFLGPGAIFSLLPNFPSDIYQNNGGLTLKDETPNYSEEEMTYFRETGDTSIFGDEYICEDGALLPVVWPWILLDTTITLLNN